MAHVIILAAGKGKRMRSVLPKVLHPVAGVPMIERVLRAAEGVCPRPTIVVGHRANDVIAALGQGREYAVQTEQRGTGHAVLCALEACATDEDDIVVLPGDHPFVTPGMVRELVSARRATDAAVALATVRLDDFEGSRAQFASCGRIVRSEDGGVAGIVERNDATDEQASITEVNVSYYCFRGPWLKENVTRIASGNAAGERYLTDLVAMAHQQGERVVGMTLDDAREGMGVNTPEQLAALVSA